MACKSCGGKSTPIVSKQQKLQQLQGKSITLPNGARVEFNAEGKAFKID